jgi:hypothetical protein
MHEISNTQAPDPNNTQFPNSNNENIVWLLGDSNYVENSFPNPSNPTLLKGGEGDYLSYLRFTNRTY